MRRLGPAAGDGGAVLTGQLAAAQPPAETGPAKAGPGAADGKPAEPEQPAPVHPSVWSAPVRFVECDMQGIVFHAHYLTWADESVVPTLAALGTPYTTLAERGLQQVVVATELAWKSSARWGETVEVDGAVERVGSSTLVLVFTIRVGERVCCTVRTTYVHLGADGRPARVPDDLRAAWTARPGR